MCLLSMYIYLIVHIYVCNIQLCVFEQEKIILIKGAFLTFSYFTFTKIQEKQLLWCQILMILDPNAWN